MKQEPLFRLALEALVITAFYEPAEGWRLRVLAHRQGEPWSDGAETLYFRLTTSELADVIACEALSQLQIS